MDASISRESQWVNKQSTVAICESIHEKALSSVPKDYATKWNKVKQKVKSTITSECNDHWLDKVKPLLVQGKLPELIISEKENITWKSIMFGLPQNVLQFITNASIDSLPSYVNLYRWGKRLTNKCHHCPNTTGTLHHILSHCPVLLERYTWRHNSILRAFINRIKPTDTSFKLYADIEGYTIAGGSIPPHILATNQRPDIVLVWDSSKEIVIIELTVPFETNIAAAHQRKEDRYEILVNDLSENGFKVTYFAIEIGCRGQITKENKLRLKQVTSKCKVKPADLFTSLSKCAILCSYSIFYSRKEDSWKDVNILNI